MENHTTDHDNPPTLDVEKVEPHASIGSPIERVESDPYGSRPICFRSTAQECLFVLTATIAIAQNSILTGAILCMSSYIGDDLKMTSAGVTWISAALSLAGGSFLLFFGRVADLFGRRKLLLGSLTFFTICLIILGFATNTIFLDVFTGLSGLSAAASVPPAIGKLGAVYEKPSRRKNRAFACFSAGNPIGFVIGAFIAGVTMQITTWRASFWVMAVIYAFFTAAAWWTVPYDEEQTLGGFNMETFAKFDFVGAICAVAGFGMFTASLTLAGDAPHGWRSSYVIALLVTGVVLMAAFVYWQSVFKYPLMPLSVWRDRNFTLLVTTLCFGFYGFSGNLFWITLVWQRIDHASPLMVAVRLLPAAVGGILTNILAALIMHRVSNKLMMITGAASLVIASALLSATSTSISYWALTFPALIFSVLGCDLQFCITNMYVMGTLSREQQSVAGGLFNTVTRIAYTVGSGVQTSIFNAAGGSAQGSQSVAYRPYQTTFWVSLVGAVLGLALTPFLTIGAQGGRTKKS